MFTQRCLFVFGAFGVSAMAASNNTWQAPSATDLRSPCPMVNTLANHGFLPRDGVNVSLDDLLTAFSDAINLDSAATSLVGSKALATSTTGDNSTFNLDDLDTHNILEHDGSLSRNDIYFGDNHSFNTTIWASVAAFFTNDTIDVNTAAKARSARLAAAESANPAYNLPSQLATFSQLETALYLTVFSNGSSETAVTEWVEVMFSEERLPYEEGYVKSESVIMAADVLKKTAEVQAASSL